MDLIFKWLANFFQKLAAKTEPTAATKPFKPSRQSSPKVKDGDTVKFDMICPTCNVTWAEAEAQLGGQIGPDCFHVKEAFKSTTKIEADKPIFCPSCGWEYTQWAIHALILTALNRNQVKQKTGEGWRSFGGKE